MARRRPDVPVAMAAGSDRVPSAGQQALASELRLAPKARAELGPALEPQPQPQLAPEPGMESKLKRKSKRT